jgi:hypothetical protein
VPRLETGLKCSRNQPDSGEQEGLCVTRVEVGVVDERRDWL